MGVISISVAVLEVACLGVACISGVPCVSAACLKTEFVFSERLSSHKVRVSWRAAAKAKRVAKLAYLGKMSAFHCYLSNESL